MPVNLDVESVTIGYALKSKFSIPSNASHLWSALAYPFDILDNSNKKRSIKRANLGHLSDDYDEQKYNFQKYTTESNVLDHIDSKKANNLASMRWTVYKTLAEIAERCIQLNMNV